MKTISSHPKHALCSPIRPAILCGLAIVGAAATASANLIIVPTFDASITNDPNATAIEQGINNAIAQVQGFITNPVTVQIKFVNTGTNGLGSSATLYDLGSYSAYRAALQTHQTSANDATALATLPVQANNPADNTPDVLLTTALERALGLGGVLGPGEFDSTIFVAIGNVNFPRTSPNPNKVDLESVVLHEISEALDSGGGGSGIADGFAGTGDLFRYHALGVRSHTTNASETAYFSINGGATNLSFYNQTGNGDYGDWDPALNPAPQLQDYIGHNGLQLDLSSNELTQLDVVGWNVNPVPEPATGTALALGLAVCSLRRWRK